MDGNALPVTSEYLQTRLGTGECAGAIDARRTFPHGEAATPSPAMVASLDGPKITQNEL